MRENGLLIFALGCLTVVGWLIFWSPISGAQPAPTRTTIPGQPSALTFTARDIHGTEPRDYRFAVLRDSEGRPVGTLTTDGPPAGCVRLTFSVGCLVESVDLVGEFEVIAAEFGAQP